MRKDTVIDKFKCWINKETKTLSFHFEEGFVEKVFDTEGEMKQFCYQLAASSLPAIVSSKIRKQRSVGRRMTNATLY